LVINKVKLSIFFGRACAVSLYVLFFYIPISSALIETFFGFAWFFFLGRLLTTKGLIVQVLKREKVVSWLFIALALSIINSGSFLSISLNALVFKWGKYIILYLMITQTLTSAPRIKYALAALSLGAALVVMDCYSQLFFGLEFLRHRPMILHSNYILALTGPFSHNNDLAVYLISVLIVILYWVFSKQQFIMIKPAAVIVFCTGIFMLTHAYSRGGWIAFILAIVLLAVLLREYWFLGISLLMTIVLGFKINLIKFLVFKDSNRFELWDIAFRMIKKHPLIGNGIGTFMPWFRSYSSTEPISYTHNCFLQLWAESGIIAEVIFCFFILKTLNAGILSYKENKDPVFLILSCAVIAFLFHSFVDTFFYSFQTASIFWVIMGLLKGAMTSQEKKGMLI